MLEHAIKYAFHLKNLVKNLNILLVIVLKRLDIGKMLGTGTIGGLSVFNQHSQSTISSQLCKSFSIIKFTNSRFITQPQCTAYSTHLTKFATEGLCANKYCMHSELPFSNATINSVLSMGIPRSSARYCKHSKGSLCSSEKLHAR